jgi:hypothetical protein
VFTVDGYINGVSYHAVVGDDTSNRLGPTVGCVAGDPGVLSLLQEQEGEPWAATPTGPFGVLDLADPASVLGALSDHTDVTSLTGDYPDLAGQPVAGVVY